MNEENEVFYTVSYLVQGGKHPGAIITEDEMPVVGGEVVFNGMVFEIIEVVEVVPPTSGFGFLHATCKYVRDEED
ncbi:MAG: hypothetical protein H6658_06825 [Ardenticatenaceae bacterium]|nr:hypothetical protein [Ardenticatenaceae bacterium]